MPQTILSLELLLSLFEGCLFLVSLWLTIEEAVQ